MMGNQDELEIARPKDSAKPEVRKSWAVLTQQSKSRKKYKCPKCKKSYIRVSFCVVCGLCINCCRDGETGDKK